MIDRVHPVVAGEHVAELLELPDGEADERACTRCISARSATHTTPKIMQFEGELVRAPIVEHCPPDVGAIKLWLINRKRVEWRDKQDTEHKLGSGFLEVFKALGEVSKSKPLSPVGKWNPDL